MAFSCCVYDGGETEKVEMDLLREKGWKGKFTRKDRVVRPGINRLNGKCPLTPLEVIHTSFTILYSHSGCLFISLRSLTFLIIQ